MSIFCPKAPADPYATTPGALIGYGKRGPIYLIGGAADEDGATGGDGSETESGSGGSGSEAAGGSGGSDSGGDGGAKPAGKPRKSTNDAGSSTEETPAAGDGDTTKLQKALESERAARKAAEKSAKSATDEATAAAEQAQAKHQETLDGLAKVLGFKKDEEPPDPAELERTVRERETRVAALEGDVASRDDTIRGLRVELAAYRAASTAGVNPVALLDSRSFLDSVTGFDPAGDSFARDLTAAVTAASKANPALLINQAASAADAGIGTAGARGADPAHVTPGNARLRAAYEASSN